MPAAAGASIDSLPDDNDVVSCDCEVHVRPLVFIGSSTEALPVAEAAFSALERVADPTLWTQEIFLPGK